MPVYEYLCRDCRQKVTIEHGMRSPGKVRCPVCRSEDLQRVFSSVMVVKSAQARSRDVSWIDDSIEAKVKKARG